MRAEAEETVEHRSFNIIVQSHCSTVIDKINAWIALRIYKYKI
jgi:hypothetical protein